MKSTNHHKKTQELINYVVKEKTFEIAKKSENQNYASPLDGLKDLDFLRNLSSNSNELTFNYIYLLD